MQLYPVAGGRRARRSPIRATVERGFTLLEVLVALVIAVLALGALFTAESTGLLATETASLYEQALTRARSHLTAAVHARPLVAGDWQGDDGGGFAWRLHVAPIAATTVRPINAVSFHGTARFPLTLYAVTVWVSWHGRQVRLDTEQIGQAAQ